MACNVELALQIRIQDDLDEGISTGHTGNEEM